MITKPRILLADPPWHFQTYSDKATRSASKHYRTMTLADLCFLPVQRAMADDAILLLWATWPTMEQAFTLGAAWGFTYKTLGFLWVKLTTNGHLHTGLGYYTRANSEPCLLFTRGQVGRDWIKDRGVHSIIEETGQEELPGFGETIRAQVMAHSAKPEIVYRRIETLVDGPYLEMFGRRPQPGWTVLGDAVTGRGIDEDLREMVR